MKNLLTSVFTGIIFLILFIGGALFSQFVLGGQDGLNSRGTSILAHVEASQKVTPDKFVAFPKFSFKKDLKDLDKDAKNKIDEDFSQIVGLLQKSQICTGGSYSVEPVDTYENGLKSTSWQLYGSLDCEFETGKSGEYFDLINKINSILDKNKLINISVAALNSKVGEHVTAQIRAQLEQKIIEKAGAYAQNISQKLGKTCKLANISLVDASWRYFEGDQYALKAAEPLAIKNANLSMRGDLTLLCE